MVKLYWGLKNLWTTEKFLIRNLWWSQGPTKSFASGETGSLCLETYSSVSMLVTAMMAAIIGHNKDKPNYWLHSH